MNDEEKKLLYMLCAAVDEKFSGTLFKIGPKGQEFQEYWKQIRDGEACGAAASPLQSVPDMAADTLRRENAALRDELEAARQEARRLAAQLRECRQQLETDRQARQTAESRAEAARQEAQQLAAQLRECRQQLETDRQARQTAESRAEAARQEAQQLAAQLRECRQQLETDQQARQTAENRAEAARQEAQRLEAQLQEYRPCLPDQRQLEEEYAFLRSLPPDAARLLAPYYALDNLPAFLVSCGQFNRLAQCWDACGRAVAGGAPGEPLATCLRRLLGLYNLASADTPAETVEPQPGAPYDCNTSQRINSDGRTVRTLLLPGLRNPGGKLLHKALVRLDQGIS